MRKIRETTILGVKPNHVYSIEMHKYAKVISVQILEGDKKDNWVISIRTAE